MTALYGYLVVREMLRKRNPIPEELEYVEKLRA
ncbi:hypothetical protein SAMN05216170_1723 [Thermococcus thioreducens]|uniref:Uncharacterized protein n=1 Tax=Thermococcus thioreducens TaxID=277988 RepID=A0A1I0PD29_9EURY|nr:hypothetical protein SAMN05216170_1723 [Thermococcus thioreducens]